MMRRIALTLLFAVVTRLALPETSTTACAQPVIVTTDNQTTTVNSPPCETGSFLESNLVDVTIVDPALRLDIRYATANNFVGRPVYEAARAYLQRPAAEALSRAHARLRNQGLGLVVHDAYRPWQVTKTFWDVTPPEQKEFVADPLQGSRHNRGCAVDVALCDGATGKSVALPTEYDDFTSRSYPTYTEGSRESRSNRDTLRAAMEAEGFTVYPTEWWHYDYRDWQQYRLDDRTFSDVARRSQQEPTLTSAGLELTDATGDDQPAVVFGDVKTILDGTSTGSRFREVKPGTFQFALGAASVTPDAGIQGETFVLGGRALVKQTGEQTNYATRADNGNYWAGFLAGIPPNAKPSARYRVKPLSRDGVAIERVYKELAQAHPGLIAIFGAGRFDEINASAVKRAPAFGQPILGPNQKEYFHPTAASKEQDAVFFGLLLSSPDAATSQTRHIFYINPQDKATSGPQSHTHFARLRPGAQIDLRQPRSIVDSVDEVAHLLTQSRVEAGDFYVYEIGPLRVE